MKFNSKSERVFVKSESTITEHKTYTWSYKFNCCGHKCEYAVREEVFNTYEGCDDKYSYLFNTPSESKSYTFRHITIDGVEDVTRLNSLNHDTIRHYVYNKFMKKD